MTPEELRADMPTVDEVAYFNTGASAPSPERVIDAMTEGQEYHSYVAPAEEGMYPAAADIYDDTRDAVADLINATPADVALTQSTTDGINLVADSIDWKPGDAVVRTDVEHPAGILPWRRLADIAGIEVRTVENQDGYFDLDAFKEAIDGAKLVCLSALAWNYGTRLPVGDVIEITHDAGTLALVDAVQAPGQMPVDIEAWNPDFLAGASHKWLLGPWGAGFLYVNEDVIDDITQRRIGSSSVVDSSAPDYEFEPGASRFEVSTKAIAPYFGLQEAIEMHHDIGVDTIQDRIRQLTERLKDGIDEEALVSPPEYESGLVSFAVDDPEEFVEELVDDDVVIRSIPYPECVRASVHVFNTADEIDALLEHV